VEGKEVHTFILDIIVRVNGATHTNSAANSFSLDFPELVNVSNTSCNLRSIFDVRVRVLEFLGVAFL
jgi:hypothetical protein